MCKINLSSQSDHDTWKYLPDYDTLSQYLNNDDTIMLSMVCKNYRKQLSATIFSKLDLTDFPLAYYHNYLYMSFWNSISLDISLGLLRFILDKKLLHTRKVILNNYFKCKFSKKFVYFLPNVTKLVFHQSYSRGTLSRLSMILNGLKQLKHVEFNIEMDDEINFNTNTQVFPQSLTSIIINTSVYVPSFLRIFDAIDSKYTNLIALSITSNTMLTNFFNTMPKLKQVDILNSWNLDSYIFIEFFKKNPQITKLKTRFDKTNAPLYNTVLSSKHLRYWSIECNEYLSTGTKFISNYSITHLKLDSSIGRNIALQLINSCCNIKIVEFISWSIMNDDDIEWDKLNRSVNTLKFVNCTFKSAKYIRALVRFNFFNQAHFSFSNYDEYFHNKLKKLKFKNYVCIVSNLENYKEILFKKKL